MFEPLALLFAAIEISGTAETSTGMTRSNWSPHDSWKRRPWLSIWRLWFGMLHASK